MKSILLSIVLPAALAAQHFFHKQGYPVGCTTPDVPFLNVTASLCQTPELRPPGSFTPPRLGESYIDPTYGYEVEIATPAGFVPTYSTPSPLSATGKYLACGDEGFSRIFRLSGKEDLGRYGVSQDWGFWWHSTDDDAYFYLKDDRFRRGSVTTRKDTVVLDGPALGLTGLRTGGTGDPSRDHWVTFWSNNAKRICLAPLDGSQRVWCIDMASVPMVDPAGMDFVLLSKGIDARTGSRYMAVLPWGVMLEFDGRSVRVAYPPLEHPDAKIWDKPGGGKWGDGDGDCEPGEWCKTARWDHADTFELEGRQYLYSDYEREGPAPQVFLAVYDMTDAAAEPRFVLAETVRGSAVQGNGTHYSCARNAPVCVAGFGYSKISASDFSTLAMPQVWAGDVMTIDFSKLPVEIRRLAKHRSIQFSEFGDDYYSMNMCSISPDAQRVACKSNFGYMPSGYHPGPGDSRRTILLRTELEPLPLRPLPRAPIRRPEIPPGGDRR
jgi:hypothetical protein